MTATSLGVVRISRERRTAIITLDNPRTRNAISGPMLEQLRNAFLEAESNPQVRAVVVTGANGAFSSGHDIRNLRAAPEESWDIEANRPFAMPRFMTKPVLAAIDGPAYGAGFILALNCDIRYATPRTTFCGSGARLGLLPIGGQLSLLPHLMAGPVALEMLLAAQPIDAATALRAGFITRIVEEGDLLSQTLERAHTISQNAPSVVASIKRAFHLSVAAGVQAAAVFEECQAFLHGSSLEAREGAAAFLEKREPNFDGGND